ncbi:DUF2332 domain-containing protein [Bacillus sp. AK128]
MNHTLLSEQFKKFAQTECRGSSPLYEHLAIEISNDQEILKLCENARSKPIPNLLFAAVHYLLFKGNQHPLRRFYPSLQQQPIDLASSYLPFKDFCSMYKEEITMILKSKLVQTNEVRRCTYLYPSFCHIYSIINKPLALIEIGTSAGFQLLWDKYRYRYGTDHVYGNKDAMLELTADIKGDISPALFPVSPPVGLRIGVDLHLNDVRNNEDFLWLKALIWPEHAERIRLLEQAASCIKETPVNLIEGDGIDLLSKIAAEIPSEYTICIFHTHVANQFSVESKHKLLQTIKEIGSSREVFHLYNNIWDQRLHLDYIVDQIEYENIIGNTEGHGRWFTWELSKSEM